jgi:hypothetical protein
MPQKCGKDRDHKTRCVDCANGDDCALGIENAGKKAVELSVGGMMCASLVLSILTLRVASFVMSLEDTLGSAILSKMK